MRESVFLRALTDDDVGEHADLLYCSFNNWYWNHGWGRDYFSCSSQETSIFYDIYNDLTPGHSIAAFDGRSGRMMGTCFFHPREVHVSLGIMSVHPKYFVRGVGRRLVSHVLDFTRDNGYRSCRVVSSALNMDSFSLYNRAGFIPRVTYQDMVVAVGESGLCGIVVPGQDRVRDAVMDDCRAMGELEMEVSGIRREMDYRYAVTNPRGVQRATVYENDHKGLEGFLISVQHPALNMIGPCVARTQEVAVALMRCELERYRQESVLFCIPVDKRKMVETVYSWHAVNVETHLLEVWGEFKEFDGVSMPSFLPETG